ncbi:hypothetical protein LZQ00_03605 [Sphingobacterium sp. SRCM116780]|uniref:hypothetical protein n=1 Tax=Sphingobacterium sp. SRCM116780 TaxID=2907623 RepID=UPI001F1EF21A|nr:hypothetical protein [Sphingobacterium sp. SRCM116780]UIR56908.1 hypothetical protein LZQ00_03605 [Sphingobacterium sp. SRCM116780]
MIITLKTQKESLNKLMDIPLLGAFLFFLLAMLPVPLLFIVNSLFDLMDNALVEKTNALITGVWNVLLTFGLRIQIGIFFIPCWILFLVIGIFRYIKLS